VLAKPPSRINRAVRHSRQISSILTVISYGDAISKRMWSLVYRDRRSSGCSIEKLRVLHSRIHSTRSISIIDFLCELPNYLIMHIVLVVTAWR
jgi:hypothetical protein